MSEFALTPPPQPVDRCKKGPLHLARDRGDDEFYTRPADIVAELDRYPLGTFACKRIYCPCDAEWSAFPMVLAAESRRLGIVSVERSDRDFRSYASIEQAERADVIMTNPPFSLLRVFLQWCRETRKDWLIVAPINIFGNRLAMEMVMRGEMDIHILKGRFGEFYVPAGARCDRVDPDTGRGLRRVRCAWLTNIKGGRVDPVADPTEPFDPARYRWHDDGKSIEVPSLAELPSGCPHVMGVPITYLAYHNPDRFEILDLRSSCHLGGELLFRRILIKERFVY